MASSKLQMLTQRLPAWMQDWLEVIVPGTQILLIVLAAWLIQRTLRRLMRGASARYQLPDELVVPINGLLRWNGEPTQHAPDPRACCMPAPRQLGSRVVGCRPVAPACLRLSW